MTTEETKRPDPVETVALAIGCSHKNPDGTPQIGRATRKKAQAILDALRAAGWRVLR